MKCLLVPEMFELDPTVPPITWISNVICHSLFCVQWVQLKWEVIVRFIDIGGIDNCHCLNFLFIIIREDPTIILEMFFSLIYLLLICVLSIKLDVHLHWYTFLLINLVKKHFKNNRWIFSDDYEKKV
jgi:hypothetical protein